MSRVLLANNHLQNPGGSETFTLALYEEFKNKTKVGREVALKYFNIKQQAKLYGLD